MLEVLRNKPEDTHMVITGYNAPDGLIKYADLVTEMELIKHPFRSARRPRLGVSF